MTEFDSITGLYTKEAFYLHGAKFIEKNHLHKISILVSDISDFKMINERYGREVGDQVLQFHANFIKEHSTQAIVARTGVDQFVSLYIDDGINNTYENLMTIDEEEIENAPVFGFKLKYALYSDADKDLSIYAIYDRVMLALQNGKEDSSKKIQFYDDSIRLRLLQEQTFIMELENSLKNDYFKVFYQPKHDSHTGELVGAEALIRWVHPVYGFFSPNEFIPVFEKNGLIHKVDYFVWTKACQVLRKWMDLGIRVVPISVNSSKIDYDYPNFVDKLLEPIYKYNLDPSLLHIEVTETLFSEDVESLMDKVNLCRKAGFGIEMDDFGSKYSSMNLLGSLPLDVVKLDMSFMQEINDERRNIVLASIIKLAKSLNLNTVAEGVETKEQLNTLKRMGCDHIQGYYFSKPLNENDFMDYLIQQNKKENRKKHRNKFIINIHA